MKITKYAFSVFLLAAGLLGLTLAAKATSFSVEPSFADCPVTRPPSIPLVPPPAFPARPPESLFWYGSEALWTALPVESTWGALPHDEHGNFNKLPFWSVDFDVRAEPTPDLLVRARRLDGDAAVYEDDQATNGYSPDSGQFMLTGVVFATPGCWEVTGNYRDARLRFVVWVAP